MPDVKMKVNKGCGGCSHAGQWYAAVKGFVTVPVDAVKVLISHGWEVVAEEVEKVEEEVKAVIVEVKDELA